jgi:excisionase family DNA binding protein
MSAPRTTNGPNAFVIEHCFLVWVFEYFVYTYTGVMSAVTEKDRAQAREMLHALGSHPRITTDDGAVLELPPPVLEALAELLGAAAEGERAFVLRSPGDITTEQAAALLGVSRPTVVRLVEAGKLPARMVGTHRRLTVAEVLAYRETSAAKRSTSLDEMTREAEELGLYD